MLFSLHLECHFVIVNFVPFSGDWKKMFIVIPWSKESISSEFRGLTRLCRWWPRAKRKERELPKFYYYIKSILDLRDFRRLLCLLLDFARYPCCLVTLFKKKEKKCCLQTWRYALCCTANRQWKFCQHFCETKKLSAKLEAKEPASKTSFLPKLKTLSLPLSSCKNNTKS